MKTQESAPTETREKNLTSQKKGSDKASETHKKQGRGDGDQAQQLGALGAALTEARKRGR